MPLNLNVDPFFWRSGTNLNDIGKHRKGNGEIASVIPLRHVQFTKRVSSVQHVTIANQMRLSAKSALDQWTHAAEVEILS